MMTGTYSKLLSSSPAPISKSAKVDLLPKKPTTILKKKPEHHPINHDALIPSNHDTTVIEKIRKATKQFGKEAATHRFTEDEKRAIAEIVYLFKLEGIRTSENEVVRIAINWIILDFKRNKKSNLLQTSLNALHK